MKATKQRIKRGPYETSVSLAKGPLAVCDSDHAVEAFEVDAVAVLEPLRKALSRVIKAIPDPIERSFDLQRVLGLDTKLAWQIYKFTSAKSVFKASVMLPGRVPAERFLAAAVKRGVSRQLSHAVMEHFRAFEHFVVERAADRATFNSIVSADNICGNATDLFHKKSMFRAVSHFLGVQTEVQIVSFIFYPSATMQGRWDLLTLRYKVGVQRLRPDVNINLASVHRTSAVGVAEDKQSWFEAVQLPSVDGVVSLIPSLIQPFCSDDEAEMLIVREKENLLHVELAAGGVGAKAKTTWAFGAVERNIAAPWPLPGELLKFNLNSTTAVESVVFDFYFYKDTPEPVSTVSLYPGQYTEASANSRVVEPIKSVVARIIPMGSGLAATKLSEAPQYSELVEYCCKQVGWNLSSLNLYRCKAEYPLFGCSTDIRFQFPSLPQSTTLPDGQDRR